MPEPDLPRVAILISGRGSNMGALVTAMREGAVAAAPAIVISNVPGAPGLAAAAGWGIETAVVDHTVVKPREAHERAILAMLEERRVQFVCLAGYMRRLSPSFVGAYKERILNVHPALLPAFPGLDAQAGRARVRREGVRVHGPLRRRRGRSRPDRLAGVRFPSSTTTTAESLSARILAVEHTIYPKALHLLATGRLEVDGRRVRILS